MTTTVITTGSVVAGVAHTFAADGDELLIGPNIVWGSSGNDLFANGGFDILDVTILGAAISGGQTSLIDDSILTIGVGGSWTCYETSAGSTALFIAGTGSIFNNHGMLSANQTVGVVSEGGNTVNNTGSVFGASGVFLGLFGATGDRLVNSGTISAGDYDDANRDHRYNNAVFSEGGDTVIQNLAGGQLTAVSSEGAGIRLDDSAGGSRVSNAGEVTSLQWWGVDFSQTSSGGTSVLINSGTISGAMGAFIGSSLAESVTNSGLMIGDVSLGDGADTFDGRGGSVQGDVLGGAGDDTFIVDDATISLVENAAEGTDLVRSAVGWTLGDNFENLQLIGDGTVNGTGNGAANTITGNAGDNVLAGRGGADTLDGGAGDDVVRGGRGGDLLHGGDGDDTLRGQRGNDELRGEDGNDWLRGAHGDDQLYGGDGDDTLVGGAGADTLTGNADDDVFLFLRAEHSGTGANSDTITDFTAGEDLIDVSALAPGGLSYRGPGSFTGSGTAELRVTLVGSDSRVLIDLDGDGSADARILVDGVITLSEGDFVL